MSAGKAIDFGAAVNFGVERLKTNLGMNLGFGGAVLGVGIVLTVVLVVFVELATWLLAKVSSLLVFLVLPVEWVGITLIYGLIFGVFMPGFFSATEKDAQGGKSSFASLYANQARFKESFIAAVLSYVAILLGSLLCVVPGILVSPVLFMSLYLVWRGETGVNAFLKSFPLLFENLRAWGYLLILGFASGLGALLCLVGMAATIPLAYAASWHVCEQLCSEPPKEG
jgi:uncharacterized membrane protein